MMMHFSDRSASQFHVEQWTIEWHLAERRWTGIEEGLFTAKIATPELQL
jgi:hypothetical protein